MLTNAIRKQKIVAKSEIEQIVLMLNANSNTVNDTYLVKWFDFGVHYEWKFA